MVFLKKSEEIFSSQSNKKKKFSKFSTHDSNGLQVNRDSKVKQVLFDTKIFNNII